jgi:hypothetical protein
VLAILLGHGEADGVRNALAAGEAAAALGTRPAHYQRTDRARRRGRIRAAVDSSRGVGAGWLSSSQTLPEKAGRGH